MNNLGDLSSLTKVSLLYVMVSFSPNQQVGPYYRPKIVADVYTNMEHKNARTELNKQFLKGTSLFFKLGPFSHVFVSKCEMCQQLLDILPQSFIIPSGGIVITLVIP